MCSLLSYTAWFASKGEVRDGASGLKQSFSFRLICVFKDVNLLCVLVSIRFSSVVVLCDAVLEEMAGKH